MICFARVEMYKVVLVMVLVSACMASIAPGADLPIADSDADGLEDALELEIGSNPESPDTDGDSLSDYDEYCKYRTDPANKDSDGDGTPDADWNERREYAYSIRAICEIRSPCQVEMLSDLYQDARATEQKSHHDDGEVVEMLLFPMATSHSYQQKYPYRSVEKALEEFLLPTVSMNYSEEMQEKVKGIVDGSPTCQEAIQRIARYPYNKMKYAKYLPHWEYFHVIGDKLSWHGSFNSDKERDQFLETNFFADSMFSNGTHGSCSSLAILRGAMYRSAGLPCRIIQTLPLITRHVKDPTPLMDGLRNRTMAEGYSWGPTGMGGANHMYNEVYLNNRWVRADNEVGTGPFVTGKLFVKVYHVSDLNGLKEEWNEKRCFRALEVTDTSPIHNSRINYIADIAATKLHVKPKLNGLFEIVVQIENVGQVMCPRISVKFYAGDPKTDGRLISPHIAGPIMPGGKWGECVRDAKIEPGDEDIFVVIDADNRFEETDENNNVISKAIQIQISKKSQKSNTQESDAAKDTYYEVYGAMKGENRLSTDDHDLLGTSKDVNSFDVSACERFFVYFPPSSERFYLDAIGLDDRWVNSGGDKENSHVFSNLYPTGSTWDESGDSAIEGPPDSVTLENILGQKAIYGFSTMGASKMTVYLRTEDK